MNKQRWFEPGMANTDGNLVPGNQEAPRQIMVLREKYNMKEA